MLADRLDRLEPPPVDTLGDAGNETARVRRLASSRCPTSGCSRRAARCRASPSGMPYGRSTRRGPARKPASTSREITSVSTTGCPSNRSRPRAASRRRRARRRRGPRSRGAATPRPAPQRHEGPAAAFDEEHGLAAEEDDLRAGDARGARTRPLRPGQRCAVRLRRVGRGEDERLGLLLGAQLTQPLDRSRQGELRAAETLDEIAAPQAPIVSSCFSSEYTAP